MRPWKQFLTWAAVLAMLFSGCGMSETTVDSSETEPPPQETDLPVESNDADPALAVVDSTSWNYNEADGVYWQVQIPNCEDPVDLQYETLGIFVPEAYMSATDNGDGTYTCVINPDGTIGGYTAQDAPIVIPVNTPGYAAMAAPQAYAGSAVTYTEAGFIYVNAGCRGREAGAPAGVTDLKAAVRYLRYSADTIPGSVDRIFTFGMSGGAQSALMGATGDSALYEPYLEAIGAVQGYSDAVAGSMCWCLVTNLDYADEAYEWNMGSTRTDLDAATQELSDSMAAAFAAYLNDLGLTDGEGNPLVLTESEEGIYQAGSYYDYIKAVIEQSLNNFLADTTFPYTASGSDGLGDFGGFGDLGGLGGLGEPGGFGDRGEKGDFGDLGEKGEFGGRGDLDGGMKGDIPGGFVDENGQFQDDGIVRNGDSTSPAGGTYETVQDYIDSLNANGQWVLYDSETNTATITSVADFVANCKRASKNVGAFDDWDEAQGENILFGYGDGSGAHFDPVMAELLTGTAYEAAYAEDLTRTDAQGNTVDIRVNMYNPMYFLCDYYEGFGTANVATYWRIRTGINQGDTALSTEVNLALALERYGAQVDFATVWGMAHTMAERTGEPTGNFVEWVNACLQQEPR